MTDYSKGFTLVELMIVVAIVGILASIAVPNFVEMQYKAKRAELPINVALVRTAEVSYDALYDGYIEVPAHPLTVPGKKKQRWAGGNSGLEALGFIPSGTVRGQYQVRTVPGRAATNGGEFTVVGLSDCDGDGSQAKYTATNRMSTKLVTPAFVY